MKKLPALCALALAGALAAPRPVSARIESLDLRRMLDRCDGAVYGEILAREAFLAPDPSGAGTYFTRLSIAGVSLDDGRAIRVDVHFAGGFVDAEHGAWSSEAPSADDTEPGARVVAFYRFSDDLGAGFGGNALYAAQGGLYRAVDGPLGPVLLGRGADFAVDRNLKVESLGRAVRTLRAEPR